MNLKIEKIQKLHRKEKIYILNILKENNCSYTKNANGYFFDLTCLDPKILDKLNECIELIETNRDIFYEIETKRDEMLYYYKKLIEEKLTQSIKEKKQKIND